MSTCPLLSIILQTEFHSVLQEQGSEPSVTGHPKGHISQDIRDHLTGYLIRGYLTRGYRVELLVFNAEIELGGSDKTKQEPSLISDHANRLDLAGTFEGTFLRPIPSGTIVSTMSPCITPAFLMMAPSSQRPPACAESAIVVSAYSSRAITASGVDNPNFFSIPSCARIPEPNREALPNSNQTSTSR